MNRMSPLARNSRVPNTDTHRTGATLVEVLMALLIMAVGVTSVFTLFPISIIKAIKANQLTNAKLYEGAIKDTLLTHPQLWTGAPEWSENTAYYHAPTAIPPFNSDASPYPSRWVTPKTAGRLLPDTNQLFYCSRVPAAPAVAQYSGTRSPEFQLRTDWNSTISQPVVPNATLSRGGYMNEFGQLAGSGFPATVSAPPWFQYTPDASLIWTPYRHSPYLANTLWSSYVVDPLGWHRSFVSGTTVIPDVAQFGRITSGDISGSTAYLDRIHCQISSGVADQIFRLQDSWGEVLEATEVIVTTPTATTVQIEFPPTLAATVLDSSLSSLHRVVLLSTLSTRVVVLPVLSASNTPAGSSFLTINGSIPAGFVPADFDQARIEIQSPSRYSWLMSVHSGPRGEYNAQCAIVFNRSFETLDEQGYRAEFCVTEDLNNNGVIDAGEDTMFPNGRLDTNIAKVRWPDNPNIDPPRIKEGGYLFDASYGYWYKIQKIEVDAEVVNASDSTTGTGYRRTIMTLSDQVKVSSSAVSGGTAYFTDYGVYSPATATLLDTQAVLMPGVVHVFTPEIPQ